MQKRILTIMFASILVMSTLAGCGKAETMSVENTTTEAEVVTETASAEATSDVVEETHVHAYVEEVTKEPTCLEEGEKTFTCDCGDTYTEVIPTTDHDFSNYVSNEDATYTSDGTETATCPVCGETDTRVAEGSMLTYTFENMEATKYAKSTVNVRSLPTADGEKLGALSLNDEVKVTGKCNETGWYRIEYSGSVAYVSDSYLVDNKVETKPAETASSNSSDIPTFTTYAEVKAYAISLGYPICGAIDNGDGTAMTYFINCVEDNKYTSWDYEYESRLADLSASRKAADAILGLDNGFHWNNDKFVSSVLIAHCDANHDWYVSISKWSHNPNNCDGTNCH